MEGGHEFLYQFCSPPKTPPAPTKVPTKYPPEQSAIGDTDGANEVKEGSCALTDEAEELHDMEECLSSTSREELMTVCDRSETDCLADYAKDLADKLRVEQDPAASKMLELRLDESRQWHGAFKMLLKRLA